MLLACSCAIKLLHLCSLLGGTSFSRPGQWRSKEQWGIKNKTQRNIPYHEASLDCDFDIGRKNEQVNVVFDKYRPAR
jgi:hypothetical protein